MCRMKWSILRLVVVLMAVISVSCGDEDSGKTDSVNQDQTNNQDTRTQDLQEEDAADTSNPDDTQVDIPTEDTQTDPDEASDIPEDQEQEPDETDVVPNTLTGTITVKAGEAETVVDLSTLETTTFEDKLAVRLTRIVEVAALELPFNYHYNFIGNDGFNVLVDKMEGDYSKLPWWLELNQGYVYFDQEKETLRIAWDESLGFPGSLSAKGMDGGTIEAVEVELTKFVVIAGEVRALLDTSTLPTQDVVDYKHPEDGAKPMIPIADIFIAAGITTPDTFAYKFFGKDGFSNNDDNLMPYENTTHGYYEPEKRRIILEEAWDTNQCCWSVKDTVLILGVSL